MHGKPTHNLRRDVRGSRFPLLPFRRSFAPRRRIPKLHRVLCSVSRQWRYAEARRFRRNRHRHADWTSARIRLSGGTVETMPCEYDAASFRLRLSFLFEPIHRNSFICLMMIRPPIAPHQRASRGCQGRPACELKLIVGAQGQKRVEALRITVRAWPHTPASRYFLSKRFFTFSRN